MYTITNESRKLKKKLIYIILTFIKKKTLMVFERKKAPAASFIGCHMFKC